VNDFDEWRLDSRRIGRRVVIYSCVDSTNTLAASLASDPANDGTVVLAREQRAGRGRQGRAWHCPAGAGVLMSVLVLPPSPLRRPVVLTALASVAVCAAVAAVTGIPPRIKWPNDVLIQGRKVCGILIEQTVGTVIGIGLNVNQTAQSFLEAGLPDATSLAQLGGKPLDVNEVARRLIKELDSEYDRLCCGDFPGLEARWKQLTCLLGTCVRVETLSGACEGRIQDVSFAGVELARAGEESLRLAPETVQQIELL
jgi:BirA family biotin operon repressor/biotin-[acetyl-CoA-carboxylase] ligase